jgi:hypothetical protein
VRRTGALHGFFYAGKQGTDVTIDVLRHYCRNPRCRSKLSDPVENAREAFCCRGCYRQFYRSRCLMCEAAMERKTGNQRLCGRRKCKNAFRTSDWFGRYFSQKRPGGRKDVIWMQETQ